ncbi:MAG: hypothetical protein CMP48_15785 [Rickettsiales bacterium]|nr:hypothetical protein [Rickettsiales bacterium]
MDQNQQYLLDESDGESPIKHYLFLSFQYWKFYLISVILCLAGAYLVNRYTIPQYSVSGTLLIKDQESNPTGEVLKELDIFNSAVNLNNEIAIMRSHSLTKRVVDSLELYIRIFKTGRFKDSEIDKKASPIIFKLSTAPDSLYFAEIFVKIIDTSTFEVDLSIDSEDKTIANFGELVLLPNASFTVHLSKTFNTENIGQIFKIVLNQPQDVTNVLRSQIQLSQSDRETSIINIGMSTTNPEIAIQIISLLMNTYSNRDLQLKNEAAVRTLEFIDEQLSKTQESLFETESEMENFRAKNNIIDISQEGQTIYLNLQELEKEAQSTDLQLEYYNYLLQYLNSPKQDANLVSPSIASIADPSLSNLISQLNALRAELSVSESFASEINPQIKSLKKQVETLVSGMIETVRNLISTTEIAQRNLKNRIKQTEIELNKLPGSERKLINIQRQFTLNDDLYVYLLQKKAEAGIAKASTTPSSEVLDPPMLIAKTKPQKGKNYMMAFGLAVAIPLGFLLIRDFLTTTIQSSQDVSKRTTVPILSNIALSHKKSELILHEYPRSQTAEGFRNMRANLKYLMNGIEGTKTIMFTSFTSGDGKTFSAMNTALMMAKSGYKTILLGLDLRKPNIYDSFGFSNEVGVSNLLITPDKSKDIILQTEVDNLDLILSGPTPPIPNEVFLKPAFHQLIKELKQGYEYIIIDTPPIGLVSDAFDIATHADVTLFVIRHKMTPNKSLEILNDIQQKKLINNIGIIYNGLDYSKLSNRLEYGYGYGKRYGYYED